MILYEMLTTVVPIKAKTVADAIARVLTETPPPVTDLRPRDRDPVPPGVTALLAQMLAKKPEQRPSMREAPLVKRSKAPLIVAAGAVFLALIAVLLFLVGRAACPPDGQWQSPAIPGEP